MDLTTQYLKLKNILSKKNNSTFNTKVLLLSNTKLSMTVILNNKHYFYLLLTIFGGGLTFYFAVLGIIEHKGNFDSIGFITSTWTNNYYAKSLTFDFWTGTITGTSLY